MNGMPFPYIKSSKITFFAAENIISRSADKIIQELPTVNNIYKVRGFNITVYQVGN